MLKIRRWQLRCVSSFATTSPKMFSARESFALDRPSGCGNHFGEPSGSASFDRVGYSSLYRGVNLGEGLPTEIMTLWTLSRISAERANAPTVSMKLDAVIPLLLTLPSDGRMP